MSTSQLALISAKADRDWIDYFVKWIVNIIIIFHYWMRVQTESSLLKQSFNFLSRLMESEPDNKMTTSHQTRLNLPAWQMAKWQKLKLKKNKKKTEIQWDCPQLVCCLHSAQWPGALSPGRRDWTQQSLHCCCTSIAKSQSCPRIQTLESLNISWLCC